MSNNLEKKMLSIIIPVFNEEENIKIVYDAVTSIMAGIHEYDYELLFTDNHSTDNTFEILQQLSQTDNHIRVLRFSRNFGYQKSILTGYMHAKGDMAIQFDCDMQDPPELISEFLRRWEMGYKVVYGIRKSRKENMCINVLRKIFYETGFFFTCEIAGSLSFVFIGFLIMDNPFISYSLNCPIS